MVYYPTMPAELIRFGYDVGRNKATISCGNRLFGLIREMFSVEDKAMKAKRRFSGRNFPTRKYAITPMGRFDIGLVGSIISLLKRRGIQFTMEGSQEFRSRIDTKFPFYLGDNYKVEELNLKLRDYQMDGVRNALRYGSGTFVFPTSSGKTLLIATTIANILKHQPNSRIFVVTLTHLVGQFVQDFISYGIDPSIISPWTGETGFEENKIVVAGNVIAASHCVDCTKEIPKLKTAVKRAETALGAPGLDYKTRKKLEEVFDGAAGDLRRCESKLDVNKKVMRYFKKVDVLMVDEVHQMKRGNVITDITDFITTNHTFGYTGTLPEEKMDEWTVIGKMGPVRQVVERAKLVENKSIASVCVQFLKIRYKDSPNYLDPSQMFGVQDQLKDFQQEAEFLYHSETRNNLIAKIAVNFKKNILIIVDRLEHGEMLRDMIDRRSAGSKHVVFISGEMPEEERDRIKAEMEANDNVVCIAIAKVFSTGVNVKNIYGAIFAFVCKAKVSLVQTVGRCVRMKDDKTTAFIFDLHDCLKYSEKHHALREKIYNAEGFDMREKEIKEEA